MKINFSILLLLISFNFYSQTSFIKGYFIDNTGKRIECLINNADWDTNPSTFDYKLPGDSNVKQADITMVKEFGGEGEFSFKRFVVAIDEFNTESMGTDKKVYYVTKTLFLKEIVSGIANLYSYNNSGSMKYFFSMNSNEIPVQLEYKKYSFDGVVLENNNYKQQLFNKLRNENLTQTDFDKLEYRSNSLITIFEKYNGQKSSSRKKLFGKTSDINIYIKAGYQQNSFSADSGYDFPGSFDFDNYSHVKFGVELELVFPSRNNNNFAGFLELTHSSFRGEMTKSFGDVKMKYSTLELPMGFKYYVGLTNSSKIFFSAAIQVSFAIEKKYTMEQFADVFSTFNNSPNFNFGVGYKFKNKIILSINSTTSRALISNQGWDSEFKSTYATVGYNFL